MQQNEEHVISIQPTYCNKNCCSAPQELSKYNLAATYTLLWVPVCSGRAFILELAGAGQATHLEGNQVPTSSHRRSQRHMPDTAACRAAAPGRWKEEDDDA
jgi:hypothetical protein